MGIRLTVEKLYGYIQACIDEVNDKVYLPSDGMHLVSWDDMSHYHVNIESYAFTNAAALLVNKSADTTPYFCPQSPYYGDECLTFRNTNHDVHVVFVTFDDFDAQVVKYETKLPVVKIVREDLKTSSKTVRVYFHDIDGQGNITKVAQPNMETFKICDTNVIMDEERYLNTLGKYGINIVTILYPFLENAGMNSLINTVNFNGTGYTSVKTEEYNVLLAPSTSGGYLGVPHRHINRYMSDDRAIVDLIWSTNKANDQGEISRQIIPAPIKLNPSTEYNFLVKKYYNDEISDAIPFTFTLVSNTGESVLTDLGNDKYSLLTGITAPDPMVLIWTRTDLRGITYKRYINLYVG